MSPKYPHSLMSKADRRITRRDDQLWLRLWRNQGQASFHQNSVNPLLIQFWPSLNLAPHSRIFVPLCGKSLDILWLADQGHQVIGVELSPIAVKAFFDDNNLTPTKTKIGKFTYWKHGRITILCGDYFALSKEMLGNIDIAYDRAALTALPEDIRKLYVKKIKQIIPNYAVIFLLTVEDIDTVDAEAAYIDQEITSLYSARYEIELLHAHHTLESNPEVPQQPPQQIQYKVYKLTNCIKPT